jgi:chromosome segregation ATPase
MSYLGKNVNLALLVIIIGVIVALVGTTVFFQRSLQNRTGAFEERTETLEQCQVALANYQDQYTEAQQKVNQTALDIRKYDTLYEQKVAELRETQDTLSQTQQQLQFEKLQKEKFQTFYEGEVSQNKQLNATIATLNNRIIKLENDVEDLEDQCG